MPCEKVARSRAEHENACRYLDVDKCMQMCRKILGSNEDRVEE